MTKLDHYLAAVMFTDLEGFTALMQTDERRALEVRQKHRNIFHSTTQEFGGEILQYFGDGTLSIFNSAVDAVRCAIKMQTQFLSEPKIRVRIGIHTGEVRYNLEEIIGDSVNIAARIESAAVPGSVLISEKVFDDLKNQGSIHCLKIGVFQFKNVKQPTSIYAISNPGLVVPSYEELAQRTEGKYWITQQRPSNKKETRKKLFRWIVSVGMILIIACTIILAIKDSDQRATRQVDEASIAVLPFKSISAKISDQYFADGMMEAILLNLSKISSLKVISRTSVEKYRHGLQSASEIGSELGVAYLLEGSAQKDNDLIRITVQLIDTREDRHLWSESYDHILKDVFTLQSEIAHQVALNLKTEITPEEKQRIQYVPTNNLLAYDLFQKARYHFIQFIINRKQEDYQFSMDLYRNALSIDSSFAQVYSHMGELYWMRNFQRDFYDERFMDSVLNLSEKAISYYPNFSHPYRLQGQVYWETGQRDKGVKAFEKALEINRNDAVANGVLGYYYTWNQEWEKGMPYLYKSVQVDPYSIFLPFRYGDIGRAYLDLLDFEKVDEYARKVINISGQNQQSSGYGYWLLAHSNLVMGKREEALEAAQNLSKINEANGLRLMAEIYCHLYDDCLQAVEIFEDMERKDPTMFNYNQRYAYALWIIGQEELAMTLFKKQKANYYKELLLGRVARNDPNYNLAGIYAFLGKKDSAYYHLEAYNFSSGLEYYITHDPLFENLWHDEVFQQIVENAKKEKQKVRGKLQEWTKIRG